MPAAPNDKASSSTILPTSRPLLPSTPHYQAYLLAVLPPLQREAWPVCVMVMEGRGVGECMNDWR